MSDFTNCTWRLLAKLATESLSRLTELSLTEIVHLFSTTKRTPIDETTHSVNLLSAGLVLWAPYTFENVYLVNSQMAIHWKLYPTKIAQSDQTGSN